MGGCGRAARLGRCGLGGKGGFEHRAASVQLGGEAVDKRNEFGGLSDFNTLVFSFLPEFFD